MKYYSSKTVKQMLGVTAQTLRNWDKSGKLKPSYVKSNGYRYYSEDTINEFTNTHKIKRTPIVIGYARVSSEKQSDDLNRQVEKLSTYLESKYGSFEMITDIGSGINYSKPGLRKLIEKINNKEVDLIVVLYKDRLLRFGFELIEYFASLNNVKIEVVDKIDKTQDQELVEDLDIVLEEFINKSHSKKTKSMLEDIKTDLEQK